MTIMVVSVSSVPASSAVLEVGVSCLEAAVHLQLGEKIVRASRGRDLAIRVVLQTRVQPKPEALFFYDTESCKHFTTCIDTFWNRNPQPACSLGRPTVPTTFCQAFDVNNSI